MKSLDQFVKVWKDKKNIEALVEAGVSIPSAEDVQAYLSKLDAKKSQEMLAVLGEAVQALEAYAQGLEAEALEIKDEIQKSHERSKAFLAYNSSQFQKDSQKDSKKKK